MSRSVVGSMEHGALLKARGRRLLSRSLSAGLSCVFLAIACSDDGCPVGWLVLPKLLSPEPVAVTVDVVGSQPIACTWKGAWECVPGPRSRISNFGTNDAFVYTQLAQDESYPVHIEGPLGALDLNLTGHGVVLEENGSECSYRSLALPREDFEKVGAVLVPVK